MSALAVADVDLLTADTEVRKSGKACGCPGHAVGPGLTVQGSQPRDLGSFRPAFWGLSVLGLPGP